MPTKLTYTGAEVQELLDKIEKGDFDNAKTLEGHPASYFAIASEFTSLAESFATEQGRISFLYGYFNNGSANNALKLGGQLPTYYATATQYEILQRALSDFKSLFDSMFEKDSDGNIHAKLSLWSSGGITAGGVGSGGSGGGGGISYNRLDSWADYSADKAGYVLSALLGKDLDNRVSALANAGYVTQSALTPYALRSEIPSLVGYATESFVTSQGYITASALGGYATQSWVEGKKYLTGITSSMVTTALGYTPYNSANFTKANIKSTLGISDWALATSKPAYTASEVGALAQDSSGANADLDTILDSKTAVLKPFFQVLTNNNVGSARKGVLRMSYNGSESQLLFDHYNRLLRYRTIGENPKDWATIAFASDIPTKLSQLTDDVVAGNYLSLAGGTIESSSGYMLTLNRVSDAPTLIAFQSRGIITGFIGISQNGEPLYLDSSAVYHRLIHESNINNYALSINGGTVSGTLSVSSILRFSDTDGTYKILLQRDSSGNILFGGGFSSNNMYIDANVLRIRATESIFSSKVTARSFIGNLTGNADSATKLQTPRTIWGQNFDGTQNVEGNLTNVNRIRFSEAGAQIFVRGSNYSSGMTDNDIGIFATMTAFSGNVAIGGVAANEKLCVHGNGKFTGALTANSLTIGGVTLTYDSVNEALCINGNMYALGGITAGGAGISAYSSLESRVARIEQQLNIS